MRVVVTGCAGFIGSVVTEYLVNSGYKVLGIDNFQSSFREAVNPMIDFEEISIGDNSLSYVFEEFNPQVVCHLAAESVIGKSMTDPYIFFRDNVEYGIKLLELMRTFRVNKLVMSSTGSTYGEPQYIPMDELHPQNPINAYGESKYIFERILKWYAKCYDINYIMFRYYNVGGATKLNGERRKEETRLVPVTLDSIYKEVPMSIFGVDYPTKDGTAIRDYLHVRDVAQAHLLAIEKLFEGDKNKVYNLGSETGFTVLEIVKLLEKITGKKANYTFEERRKGDPVSLVASSKFAKEDLGWNPINSRLDKILIDSDVWYRKWNGI